MSVVSSGVTQEHFKSIVFGMLIGLLLQYCRDVDESLLHKRTDVIGVRLLSLLQLRLLTLLPHRAYASEVRSRRHTRIDEVHRPKCTINPRLPERACNQDGLCWLCGVLVDAAPLAAPTTSAQ